MAVDAPLLTRQRIFAASVEVTTGTAETLAAGDGAMNVFDAEINPNIEMTARPGQSSLSMLPAVHGARGSGMTLATYLVGNGASGMPLWADTLLLAAGFSESGGTYKPITGSTAMTTLTAGVYEDGRLRTMSGAVATATMTMTAGEPVRIEWELSGKFEAPADTALITPTYPTVIPPRFASATFTIGGTSYKVAELVLTLNNEMVMRQDATDATGYFSSVVANRDFKITVDPEAQLFATQDWYTDWFNHTEAAINIVVGSAANNTVTINAPKASIHNVQHADRDGIMTDALEFGLNRNAAAGDDELSIAFS
jgi:hypothetical protein